jgi:hypothetical protein
MSEVLCLNEKCGDERLNAKTGGCCPQILQNLLFKREEKKRKMFPATMRATGVTESKVISAVINAISLSDTHTHTHEHT